MSRLNPKKAKQESNRKALNFANILDEFIPSKSEPTASHAQRHKLLSAGWSTQDNAYWIDPVTGFVHSFLVALHLLKDAPVNGNALELVFPAQRSGVKALDITQLAKSTLKKKERHAKNKT